MVIVCNRSLFNKYGWMAFVCYFENSKGTSMTREDIIRMAREAGGYLAELPKRDAWLFIEDKYLERFAAIVASTERERIKQANAPEIERINAHIKELEDAVLAEREACAKVCDDLDKMRGYSYADKCAAAIRARGQA
jgi:hypothetical protein